MLSACDQLVLAQELAAANYGRLWVDLGGRINATDSQLDISSSSQPAASARILVELLVKLL